MDSIVNSDQADAWNGYEGEHWADHQDRYDAVNSGFNDRLLAAVAVGDGDRVLDVGCGTGQLTRLAARRAAPGSATGLDLSAPMLRRARVSAAQEGLANVSFEQGDAQVHPLPAAGFDVAVSRFGIMFFADPVAAFANIGRALRPGGRLAFVSMRDFADHDLGPVLAAMLRHLPPSEAAETGSGPLSLADPAVIRTVLEGAGFTGVTVAAEDAAQTWGRDAADAEAFLAAWGPVRFQLDQVGQDAAARARQALLAALRPYEQPGAVRLKGAAWLVTAVRP